MATFLLLIAAGFVGLGFGWHGVAVLALEPLQFPFILSAGVGGLAVIGAAVVLLDLHWYRDRMARETAQLDRVIRTTAVLAAHIEQRAARRASTHQSRG